MVFCVNGEKARMPSTSSPNQSMRTGPSAVDGYTSSSPPRTAISPRSSTCGTRSYPMAAS